MALTIKEQLDILNGVEAPTSYTFHEYIEQVVINKINDFLTSIKNVDSDIYPDGFAYANRLSSIFRQIISNPLIYRSKIAQMLIAIYSDTGTIAQIQSATDDDWVAFIDNNIISSLEKLSGITGFQKTEYDSI